jgi:hypothetical protein
MSKQLRAFGKRHVAYGLMAALVVVVVGIYVVPVLPLVPRSLADLKYSVIDEVGAPLVCTGWGMPNAGFNPYGEYAHIVSDAPTYSAIIRRQHIPPIPLTNDQVVGVYRDWLKLNAVRLQRKGIAYDFDMFPGPMPSAALRNEVVGKVDLSGHVYDVHQGPAMGGCPICLEADSLISTPNGPVAVSKIEVGARVWSASPDGQPIVAFVVVRTSRLAAPGSELIHLVLADGRQLTASAPHKIADGRSLGSLRVGDQINGVAISATEVVGVAFGRTYDLLPSGETGEYWADGILMRSTLSDGILNQAKDGP